MRQHAIWTAALGLLSLAGCTSGMNSADTQSRAPAARVVGEAEDCIQSASISSTTVHDDRTIDFKVGSKLYRNTLPYSCPSLGFERAFTYETSISRLCSTDAIYVLRNAGGSLDRGAGCGLGQFVPIELER